MLSTNTTNESICDYALWNKMEQLTNTALPAFTELSAKAKVQVGIL
jgi:hypothetical protein